MRDFVLKGPGLIILDEAEAAMEDARRLLVVATLAGVGPEFAAPVVDAAAGHVATVVAAAEAKRLSGDIAALLADADGRIADAVSALVEANEGGDAEPAREAICEALASIEALLGAAVAEHNEMREAA